MTISACTSFCRARDFPYAGVEYGTEYCGAAPKASAIAASMSDCRMPCAGNRSQSCGSGNRLQVYFNPQKDQPASTAGRVGDWMHTGCYTDSVAARALPIRATVDGGMSAAKCTAACQAKRFPVAGTEYSTAPGCGHALKPASRAPNGDCNLRCSGDFAQICGGPDRLTVFQNMPASNTMACYETSTSNDFVIEAIYRNGEPPVSLSVVKTSVDTAVLTVRPPKYI
ncbi:hypothetical protein C8R43DRAFT_882960 [Mycena crocata]|nr:hypothetical protein C8R43DRAFT_882960 [Mycena crocata]